MTATVVLNSVLYIVIVYKLLGEVFLLEGNRFSINGGLQNTVNDYEDKMKTSLAVDIFPRSKLEL